MVLVDTSVWISHFRHGEPKLSTLLSNRAVLCHPFVIGELACGSMANRGHILLFLEQLRSAVRATDEEALTFIEANRLMSKGIGYIDVHLLVSAALSDAPIWTRDRSLRAVASALGLAYMTE